MTDPFDAAPPVPKQNGLAIASVIMGVVGMFCFGPLTLIPAIIMAHVALNRARRAPDQHDSGLPIAGLVIGYSGFVVFIFTFGMSAAILLPALARAREAARAASCANNLKQVGLSTMMYAVEHDEFYPPLSTEAGRIMFEPMPNYLPDPAVLDCPSSWSPVKGMVDDQSYFYFGYAVMDEYEMEALLVAYLTIVEAGGDFTDDLEVDPGGGSFGGNVLLRLRSRYENVPASAHAQIPVMMDRADSHSMNLINVLYLDGHVERIRFGEKWPATAETFEAFEIMDSLGN